MKILSLGLLIGLICAGTAMSQTVTVSPTSASTTDVTTNYPKQYKIPVATAFAAPLTSGFDTCLGSMSGGGQGTLFGLSLGTTKVDKNCVLIKQSQMLHAFGLNEAACFRMQMGKEGKSIRDALQASGFECTSLKVVAGLVTNEQPTEEKAAVEQQVLTNPDYVTQEQFNRAFKKNLEK